MRLSVFAALGITAFLGIMTIDPPDANAQTRRAAVVSSPRSAAIVSTRGVRTAVVRPRGARGAVIMGRPRGAVVVSRRRNITRF